jgi:hypothetical protein
MKVYILGKIGKLSHSEWLNRHNTASIIELDGNKPLNFNNETALSFDDTTLQVVNEMSLLLMADAVYLLNDFNNCDDARLILLMAVRMNLPIQPAKGCVLPARLSFTINI